MDPAILTRIDAVTEEMLGMKLRLAGQVLGYDAVTALVLLRAGDAGVLVDVSDCVSEWSKSWLLEPFCTVTTIGYLERAPTNTRPPAIPKHVRLPVLDCGLVVRALLVSERADLRMDVWNAAI